MRLYDAPAGYRPMHTKEMAKSYIRCMENGGQKVSEVCCEDLVQANPFARWKKNNKLNFRVTVRDRDYSVRAK